MNSNIIKVYRHERRIYQYIYRQYDKFFVATGKPSDPCCIGGLYNTLDEAKAAAARYAKAYLGIEITGKD